MDIQMSVEIVVRRVEDQALLADLAKTAESWMVRAAAAARVEDQALLADLAKTDEDCDVRAAAAARVEDQAEFLVAVRLLLRKS